MKRKEERETCLKQKDISKTRRREEDRGEKTDKGKKEQGKQVK